MVKAFLPVSPLPSTSTICLYIRSKCSRSPSVTMNDSSQPSVLPCESNAELWANIQFHSRSLISAHIEQPQSDVISATWRQRDPIASKKRFVRTTHFPCPSTNASKTHVSSPPTELSPASAATVYPSPSGQQYVRFMPSMKNPDSGILIEVWGEHGLNFCFPVAESVHGSVYSDVWYGGVTWSPDEKLISYIADMPPPGKEKETETDNNSRKDPVVSSWANPLNHEFDASARGPYGETYAKKRACPALFIANVATGEVKLACDPSGLSIGQPQWGSNGHIVCIASPFATIGDNAPPQIPDDLGIVYCYNRPMFLIALEAPTSFEDISSEIIQKSLKVLTEKNSVIDYNCTSPRFSNDGKYLVYIAAPRDESQNDFILPHNTTKALRYIRLNGDSSNPFSSPASLIDVPNNPDLDEFPGLYLHGLPQRPWLTNDTLALTTTWGFTDRVVVAKLEKDSDKVENSLKTIDPSSIKDHLEGIDATRNKSVSVLDCYGGSMLISSTDAATPCQLALVHNDKKATGDVRLEWVTQLSSRENAMKSLVKRQTIESLIGDKTDDIHSLDKSARKFDKDNGDKAVEAFQVYIVEPSKSQNALVVFPHGGPHSVSIVGFSVATAALLARGFTVMFINYRGSLGLGEASLRTLPGNVGTQDVNEVVQATRWLLEQQEMSLDPKRTVFVGGSHSGFLGAHVSLVKDLYQRTVLRNPVTNIAAMAGATDIPDWCFVEAGIEIDQTHAFVPNTTQMEQMYQKSPVARVRKAVEDGAWPRTLLQVGGSDKRVPPTQSLEWRRLLTAAFGEGVVTLRWYEKSTHAIDDVPEGDDSWVQAIDFLCEVLDEKPR